MSARNEYKQRNSKQFAKEFGCSPMWVSKLIKKGLLTAEKNPLHNGSYLILRSPENVAAIVGTNFGELSNNYTEKLNRCHIYFQTANENLQFELTIEGHVELREFFNVFFENIEVLEEHNYISPLNGDLFYHDFFSDIDEYCKQEHCELLIKLYPDNITKV